MIQIFFSTKCEETTVWVAIDFELIENRPNNGTTYLLIFDEVCGEILKTKPFV